MDGGDWISNDSGCMPAWWIQCGCSPCVMLEGCFWVVTRGKARESWGPVECDGVGLLVGLSCRTCHDLWWFTWWDVDTILLVESWTWDPRIAILVSLLLSLDLYSSLLGDIEREREWKFVWNKDSTVLFFLTNHKLLCRKFITYSIT